MADPHCALWEGCAQSADGSHMCDRPEDHHGRCRCAWCGATTTVVHPIFDDPEELEQAQEALDG